MRRPPPTSTPFPYTTLFRSRFADARTALASGDLDITAFGPQDITLAVAQGAKSLVGVAGVGSGNDCLIVRKGDDRSEEHTSELQSHSDLVCRLLLEKKDNNQ